ncbi:MAG: hypothetical protein IKC08_03110 [Lentisphaeria bacterium]|nr:hypothetical protein [Lentisphaeria bacterium]
MKITILFTFLISLFLTTGCITITDDPFLDVPEFELRTITFAEQKKNSTKIPSTRSYLMRWNILGPVAPVSADVDVPVLENENLLCGRLEAPAGALWHVRIYKDEGKKAPAAGFCNWTNALKKYKGKNLFYGCSSFLSDKEYKNVSLTISAAGSISLYWNGEKKGVLKKSNLTGKETFVIKDLTIRKGGNRLVLKYLDGEKKEALRGVSLQFAIEEKNVPLKKTALIR